MNSPTNSFEVRVLLKQIQGEVQFLKRAPEIVNIASCASRGFSFLSSQFAATKMAENPWVLGLTTVASTAANMVGGFVKPRYDDMARHSAVFVYGEIFEFNEKGIHKRSSENTPEYNEHRIAGRTGKSKEEFLRWLEENQKFYTAQTYKTSSHNCHHFVQNVCTFLNVPIPSSVQLILNWLESGGNSVLECMEKIIGTCVASSAAAKDATPFVSSLSNANANTGSYTRIS